MPIPEASDPGSATPSGAPSARAPEPDAPSGPPRDLAAIPAFLRGRPAADRDPAPVSRMAAAEPTAADVAALPMPGIAPRRLIVIGLTIILAWLITSFGRQVAEATAASSRADDLRAATAVLADEVSGLEQELETIRDPGYISIAARAYRLGTAQEIPFALEADAPPLGPDAPGSAVVRPVAEIEKSPFERWLDVLFGPGGG
jgi:cell division protein FtsB